jgi:hypothetical protein
VDPLTGARFEIPHGDVQCWQLIEANVVKLGHLEFQDRNPFDVIFSAPMVDLDLMCPVVAGRSFLSVLFDSIERPALRALPAQDYEYAEWRLARVGLDYHVEVICGKADRHRARAARGNRTPANPGRPRRPAGQTFPAPVWTLR